MSTSTHGGLRAACRHPYALPRTTAARGAAPHHTVRHAPAPRPVLAALVLCAAAGAACRGPADPPPPPLPWCDRDVAVTVTAGATPQFSWTPRCRVSSISMQRWFGGYEATWAVEAQGVGVAPGMTYGTVPAGAREAMRPLPLERGRQYRMVLSTVERGEPMIFNVQTAYFTP